MSQASVAILLGTYNGARYLAQQLDSFTAQSHANWTVWASDDGSKDGTLGILHAYRQTWPVGRLSLVQGPARGFVANFLALSCNPCIVAEYYAYADQDDIWEADKLERALQWLDGIPAGTPALYCARTRLVNKDDEEIGLSPFFRDASFANALVQNIAGGNTMVFNAAARELLMSAGAQQAVVYHDWWVYLAVTACGGKVFCDPVPALRYRQHEVNQIGVDFSWAARFKRIRKLWRGQERAGTDGNIAALRRLENRLTPEHRRILDLFAEAREMSLLPRLIGLRRSGIYRQTKLGNLSLIAAAVFKKI